MKLRQSTHPWVIALACSLFVQTGALALKVKESKSTAAANKPLALSDQALDKDLVVLENRFFFHHYGHDPIEKRLERLELMTLGASQFGTSDDRLTRLKAAIVQRDKRAAQIMVEQSKIDKAKGESGQSGAKADTNYPVLSTLEWRILKKTYSTESMDQRLDRLESHLFGVPAQAMSYVDRIERLKKTAGVGVEAFAPPQYIPGVSSGPGSSSGAAGPFTAIRKGPMPRAGNGSLFGSLTENGSPFSATPFGESPFADIPLGGIEGMNNFDEGSTSDSLLPEVPGMENFTDIGRLREFARMPRGGSFAGREIHIRIGPDGTTSSVRNFGPDGLTGSNNTFGPADNILEQLQKPMLDFLKRLGLGTFPGTAPDASSGSSSRPLLDDLPNLNKRPTSREELPPYADPNSI
ncbi:hypothetical protein BH11CYA1_BH11CYA1_04580 [soil metagenome]